MKTRMSLLGNFTVICMIVFLGFELVSSDDKGNSCYSSAEHRYPYYGTKTPYHFVHGLIQNSSIPNCEPMQIWMAIRHGTRYPGKKEIESMFTKLEKLRNDIIANYEKRGSGSLCEKNIEQLKAWNLDPNLSMEKTKFLTKQGEEDLEGLGRRFKNYFPELLQPEELDLSSKNYKFRSTNTQRTIASMEFFQKGLFGNASAIDSQIVSTPHDTLLKVYKTCKPWLAEMKSSQSNDEVNAYLNGTEFKQLVRDVSRRLGFPNNLTLETVWLMYTACSFEKAWSVNEMSPWCVAFTNDELRIFEYEDDLYNYYHSGYGQKMSTAIGCPPLKDMFDHFSKLENGATTEEPRGVFYFSHSTLLKTFYTAMGIFEDSEPLTASNLRTMGDRKWRTSLIGPFAANFAAVFYKCETSHKVKFYVSERPLEYEGCEMGICDWEYLKKRLEPAASNCNVDFCQS